MAEIVVRLRPDGTIEAVTHGLKGDECLPYVDAMEQLTAGRTVDSHYTAEYYEGRQQVRAPSPEDQVDIGGG